MSTDSVHLINLPSDLSETEFPEMISISIICRLCANQSDKLIGIFTEEGINNDLLGKINLYLPVNVDEADNLPLQCCWQCASTVLAWHELVLTSVEADRRLRSYQFVTEKQLEEITSSYGDPEDILATTNDEETLMATDSISKHTIKYETINTTKLLIKNESQEPQFNETTNLKEEQDPDKDIYIPMGVATVSHDIEFDVDPMQTTTVQAEIENTDQQSMDEDDEKEENMYKFECLYCPTLFVTLPGIEQHLKKEHPSEKQGPIFYSNKKSHVTNNEEKKDDIQEHIFSPVKSEEKDVIEKPPDPTKNKSNERCFKARNMMKHPLPKINVDEVNKAKVEVEGRTFYKCQECGKSLHSMYTYVWHTRIHTGERPYICSICDKQFRVSQGLVRHLKETHERIKNFNCDICGRFFATKRNVEEHRRIHTNERPYICATCGKSFKQKASLFVHNRSHSSEFPFACNDCPQKFRTKPALLLHVTKHTGEKPYPCNICGRNFRIKYELKRHKLIHSEDKPFNCKICGQVFRQKRYLRNHLKLKHNIGNPSEWLDEYSNAT